MNYDFILCSFRLLMSSHKLLNYCISLFNFCGKSVNSDVYHPKASTPSQLQTLPTHITNNLPTSLTSAPEPSPSENDTFTDLDEFLIQGNVIRFLTKWIELYWIDFHTLPDLKQQLKTFASNLSKPHEHGKYQYYGQKLLTFMSQQVIFETNLFL
jgi:hypothetical protein